MNQPRQSARPNAVVRWWRRTGKVLWAPAPLEDFEDYDQYWSRRRTMKKPLRRWRLAARRIEDGATVLDIGCGTGQFLQHLKKVKPNVQCTGIDVSAEAVRRTRELGFDARVLDLTSQDIDGQYDYVTCFEVLEHVVEAERILRRAAACCRKELIVSIPNIGSIDCRLRLALFGRFPHTRVQMHMKEHVRHWTPRDFRQWVEHEGLTIVKYFGDWGIVSTPWRTFPSLFAKGSIYVLCRRDG